MNYQGRDVLLGGIFLALALAIPVLFHVVGLGSSFLPMFFPLIIAGYLVCLPVALVVGVSAPLVSALLTGMPPLFPPIAFIMMIEGLSLTGIPAVLYQKKKKGVLLTLIITLVADRLILLGAVVLTAKWLNLPPGVLGLASLVKGVPGIILILIIIPPLVKKLKERMSLIWVME